MAPHALHVKSIFKILSEAHSLPFSDFSPFPISYGMCLQKTSLWLLWKGSELTAGYWHADANLVLSPTPHSIWAQEDGRRNLLHTWPPPMLTALTQGKFQIFGKWPDMLFSPCMPPLTSKAFIAYTESLQSSGNCIRQLTGPCVELPFSWQILYAIKCGSRQYFIWGSD